MFTLLNYIDAFGTSEGVKKAWDSRKDSSVTERVKDSRVKKDAYEGEFRARGTSEGVRKEWETRKGGSAYDRLVLTDHGQRARVTRKKIGKNPWHLVDKGQHISNHRDH